MSRRSWRMSCVSLRTSPWVAGGVVLVAGGVVLGGVVVCWAWLIPLLPSKANPSRVAPPTVHSCIFIASSLFSCVVVAPNYPLPLTTARREKWQKVSEQVGCHQDQKRGAHMERSAKPRVAATGV